MSTANQSLTCRVAGSAKLSDVNALLDSLALEIKLDGLVIWRGPLCDINLLPEYFRPEILPPSESIPLDLSSKDGRGPLFSLVQYTPPPEEAPLEEEAPAEGGEWLPYARKCATRWPFYVEAPLEVTVQLGDQQKSFRFIPGEQYTERTAAEIPA